MAFPRGEVIVPIGERLRGVYHIIKGMASIQSESGDVLCEMEEGSVFGKVWNTRTACEHGFHTGALIAY
jgi:signal-transduction protein with cAMP-binding, CBS, and nucleotidyltransferase domain